MEAWFDEINRTGLARGDSFDLDFHAVPANSQAEPLEKHYVSRRSRREKGVLAFLVRDARQRLFCYGRAGILKAEQASEILRFVEFWQRRTGQVPRELVFDSQLTTYRILQQLQERQILFMTLRRRSRKLLGEIWSRPASAWQRITLPSLTRLYRTPKVLDERVKLRGYKSLVRQISIIELGHEQPTVLLTNNFKSKCPALVTRYAQRMLIENGISEAIQFFHLDALTSMVGLKVDFDLQITLMASSLYRLMAQRIGHDYDHAQAKRLFRNLLDASARVDVGDETVTVTLDKRAHNPFLASSGLMEQSTPMPWFGGKQLRLGLA